MGGQCKIWLAERTGDQEGVVREAISLYKQAVYKKISKGHMGGIQ